MEKENFFELILRTVGNLILVGAYILIALPLGIACYVLSVLLIPFDIISYVASWGRLKFEIMRALQLAGHKCVSFLADDQFKRSSADHD